MYIIFLYLVGLESEKKCNYDSLTAFASSIFFQIGNNGVKKFFQKIVDFSLLGNFPSVWYIKCCGGDVYLKLLEEDM